MRVPAFDEIEQSEVWLNQIKPWLEDMYQTELELLLPLAKDDELSLRILDYKRGFCAALKTVIDLPGSFVALDDVRRKQEEEHETVQSWRDARRRSRETTG